MSYNYTFSKIGPMGERDPKYGQSYWADVNEDLKPVMFNYMGEEEITIEDSITAEERVEKRSSKGTDYYQLKKVKVAGRAAPTRKTYDGPKKGQSFKDPEKEKRITAMWAIGQAVSVLNTTTGAAGAPQPSTSEVASKVEPLAKEFYAMIDRVSDTKPPTEEQTAIEALAG